MKGDKQGWCAPAELGEDAPHYVSFAVPVDDDGRLFGAYSCEVITVRDSEKAISSHELVVKGADSLLLHLGGHDVWFVLKPGTKTHRPLPYLGKLKHSDFAFRFVEIEPESPDGLDAIFDQEKAFVIGCDAFTHYHGLKTKGIRSEVTMK